MNRVRTVAAAVALVLAVSVVAAFPAAASAATRTAKFVILSNSTATSQSYKNRVSTWSFSQTAWQDHVNYNGQSYSLAKPIRRSDVYSWTQFDKKHAFSQLCDGYVYRSGRAVGRISAATKSSLVSAGSGKATSTFGRKTAKYRIDYYMGTMRVHSGPTQTGTYVSSISFH